VAAQERERFFVLTGAPGGAGKSTVIEALATQGRLRPLHQGPARRDSGSDGDWGSRLAWKDFEEAVRTRAARAVAYTEHGYDLIEIPRVSAEARERRLCPDPNA
jgi:predicted ATPase